MARYKKVAKAKKSGLSNMSTRSIRQGFSMGRSDIKPNIKQLASHGAEVKKDLLKGLGMAKKAGRAGSKGASGAASRGKRILKKFGMLGKRAMKKMGY